ncbi:hypothetical protein [Methylobacterium sp. ID0610]|uniref:hypothetical protein n=1 Tax=Methylobacterium carpenticola TaxID=3344827 RepID=UPI0036B6204B
MNEVEKDLFKLGTMLSATEIALRASLKRLAEASGPQSKQALDDFERACVTGIKNMTPTPNVPDAVMQSSVEAALQLVQGAFAKVRGDLGFR